jgi:hypothetical protein
VHGTLISTLILTNLSLIDLYLVCDVEYSRHVCVIGDSETTGSHPFLSRLLAYASDHADYRGTDQIETTPDQVYVPQRTMPEVKKPSSTPSTSQTTTETTSSTTSATTTTTIETKEKPKKVRAEPKRTAFTSAPPVKKPPSSAAKAIGAEDDEWSISRIEALLNQVIKEGQRMLRFQAAMSSGAIPSNTPSTIPQPFGAYPPSYSFPSTLSSFARQQVHSIAERLGQLKHASSGGPLPPAARLPTTTSTTSTTPVATVTGGTTTPTPSPAATSGRFVRVTFDPSIAVGASSSPAKATAVVTNTGSKSGQVSGTKESLATTSTTTAASVGTTTTTATAAAAGVGKSKKKKKKTAKATAAVTAAQEDDNEENDDNDDEPVTPDSKRVMDAPAAALTVTTPTPTTSATTSVAPKSTVADTPLARFVALEPDEENDDNDDDDDGKDTSSGTSAKKSKNKKKKAKKGAAATVSSGEQKTEPDDDDDIDAILSEFRVGKCKADGCKNSVKHRTGFVCQHCKGNLPKSTWL